MSGISNAGLDVAWDPVDVDIVEWYQLWYGTSSGGYQSHVDTTATTATIDGLTKGQTYYLAVRACNADLTRCSAFSNELEYTRLNQAPTGTNDSITLSEDSTGNTINVLGNDSDPDGDPLSVTSASAGKGAVSVNANGTLSYSPQANFFGSDTISYTISDGDGGSDTASVAVTVTGVNDPPVATNDSVTVSEDSGGNTISVLSNDGDIDGDGLSVTNASAGKGTVSVNANGTLTYRPQANFYGNDTISYTISDGKGGSDSASVVVTVTAVNDPPIASNDSATVVEDSGGNTINVLSNDADVDGDGLSVSNASAGKGTVSVNGNGTLSYSPQANYAGNDTISYTVSDGRGGSDTASVAVTVTGVNDPPVATNDSATVTEDSSGNTINVLGNDSDIDGDGLSVTNASAGKGTVSVKADGKLSYSPQGNFAGSDTIGYTISDGNGGTDTATVSVTVTGVNDPPVAANDNATVGENSTDNMISVLGNDTDIDGDTLSITAASASSGAVSANANGTLLYSPQANFFGSDTISYTISDGNGGTDTATVEIAVTAMAIPAPTDLVIVTSE